MRQYSIAAVVGTLVVATASPVLADAAAPAGNPDPWEHFNRKLFAIHNAIDRAVIRPIALTYKRIIPSPIRDGIHNVLSNISEPAIAANDLFQGHFHQAGLTTARLVANTTIGIGGVFDVASKIGAPYHYNDFDITLGRLNVKPGPYVFVPLLGPNTIRDLVGHGVDSLLNPLYWVSYPHQTEISVARILVGGVDLRARVDGQLESLMTEATDPYATLRSVYIQNEESQIRTGKAAEEQPLPDFGDPAPDSAAPPAPNAAPPPADPAAPPPAATAPAPVSQAAPVISEDVAMITAPGAAQISAAAVAHNDQGAS